MSILKQDQNEDVYFNFINSLKTEYTKKYYEREINDRTYSSQVKHF
jgi:hypothetical protein